MSGARFPDAVSEPRPPEVPGHVARAAVEWLVELQSGSADEKTKARLNQWLTAHPDHLRAWEHIERVNQRLAGLSDLAAMTSSHAVHAVLTSNAGAHAGRRRAMKAALLLVGCGGGVLLAQRAGLFDSGGEERTAVGERRTLIMPEGTRLVLGTDTRIRVRYDQQQRHITLLRGELMVTTAPDLAARAQSRPLLVATVHGQVQPLGTVFAVRLLPDQTQVDVFQKKVRVIPAAAPHSAILLEAGQRTGFEAGQVAAPVSLDENAGAWADGMLVVSDVRLADFLAELSRYRRGYLGCDPALADLRISGTYPLDDTDRILNILTVSQPLVLQTMTRYWVRLLPAPSKSL